MDVLIWTQAAIVTLLLITLIQTVYYIVFFRRVAFHQQEEKDQTQTHPVSVVICARDEAENLSNHLPGVLLQNYRYTHEVIVVNDNSVDETRYLLAELQRSFKHLQPVELTHEAKLIIGKKYPLSIGIKEAKHEILLLTDADCVPATEHWINKMQSAYTPSTDIVLGYSGYVKKNGFLNKVIRFETFHSALQYLGYALAGIPYMGVGRNLSYKKGLFFAKKGFSSINHIPGGDDDLFINMAATPFNTAVMLDPDSFTLSAPKKTWSEWIAQKYRHYTTARYYKTKHRFLLGVYAFTHFLMLPAIIATFLLGGWQWALGVMAFRWLLQGIVFYKAMAKLNETDLFPFFWLTDIWAFLYYFTFIPALWKKPAAHWK